MRIVQVSYGNKSNLVQSKQKAKRHWKTNRRFLTDVRFVSHALSVFLVIGIWLVFLKEVKLKTLQGKKKLNRRSEQLESTNRKWYEKLEFSISVSSPENYFIPRKK